MAKINHQQGVIVVELEPSYDSVDVEPLLRLGELLMAEIARAEPPRMVLDLTQTRYIDSMFIETIFRVWKRIKERHGSMVLCGANDVCAEVLRITKLTEIWPLCATREEAIERVTSNDQ